MQNLSLHRIIGSGSGVLNNVKDALLHLAFPTVCEGCGSDIVERHHMLCLRCLSELPLTNFHLHGNNPIEKIFWGRLPLTHATSQYFFSKDSLVQRLMHQVKYRSNKELGIYLGRLMGHKLSESNRFSFIDTIIPLPLHKRKEKKRGFNQAMLICEGISEVMGKPVLKDVIVRTSYTETQTIKNRVERWKNIEGKFFLADPSAISGRHVLLVDDVITTGATIEACGQEILKAKDTKLSIATLCFSSH